MLEVAKRNMMFLFEIINPVAHLTGGLFYEKPAPAVFPLHDDVSD